MTKLEQYVAQLDGIQLKIENLQKLEFSLTQKIEKLRKFPELNTEISKKKED